MPQIATNAIWNITGTAIPMVAGLFSVPFLLNSLGEERLGIFSLVIGLIGFTGIFDLGLGRALTQSVARERGAGTSDPAIARIIQLTLLIIFFLGAIWGLLLWIASHSIVEKVLHLEHNLAVETIDGFHWFAITLPFALPSSGAIGALEGLQRFKRVNLLRTPLGIAIFAIPAIVATLTENLGITIGSLTLVRTFGTFCWLLVLYRNFDLHPYASRQKLDIGNLWRFSRWLSVSNLVGPLMVYADRFYLAMIFPPAVVALYAVPLDTLSRATSLPLAIMNSIYPAMASHGVDSPKTGHIVQLVGWSMVIIWLTPLLLAGIFLRPLIELWLGDRFAANILEISGWLLLGILANGFAHIPYSLLHAAGRSDITAKLHLLELPIYGFMLFYFSGEFGIIGAAMAWTFRVIFDTTALYFTSYSLAGGLKKTVKIVFFIALASTLLLSIIIYLNSNVFKFFILLFFSVFFYISASKSGLTINNVFQRKTNIDD